jgi:RsiW-degrading membrane proteinase PrsW (M82 family)
VELHVAWVFIGVACVLGIVWYCLRESIRGSTEETVLIIVVLLCVILAGIYRMVPKSVMTLPI